MADLTRVNEKIKAVWPEWEVVGRVGCGTYGDVYKAKRSGFVECDAAIKLITIPKNEDEVEALGDDEALIERARAEYESVARAFSNEIRLLEVLKSAPNIVGIEDYSIRPSENGCGWNILIRMELLTSMDKVTSITEVEAVKLGMDICTALEACSLKNIIHRDVKPSNIFVTDFGTYKLGDFGISRVLEANTTSLTMRSGTPRFMAPEVIRSMFYDARADIYSLGMVLYYLLNDCTSPFYPKAGVPLTLAERDEAELKRIRGEEFPMPEGVSSELAAVIRKACAADPDKRFADASQMKKALMNVYAAKYFDGVKVTVTDEVTAEVGGIAAIRKEIREADRTTSVRRTQIAVTEPWEDTQVVDISEEIGDISEEYIQFDDEDADKTSSVRRAAGFDTSDDSTVAARRAAAIAAGAAVTEAAKVAHEAKTRAKNKKRTIGTFNRKKVNIVGIAVAVFAVVVFAVAAVITVPMINNIVGSPDTETSEEDTIEAKPQKLTITKPASKLQYTVGEKISVAGLELEASYRFGKKETLTRGFTYSPIEAKGEGTQTVTLSYNGASVTYEIEVLPLKVMSLLIASRPERTEFSIGENIDFTGLILDVVYEDGSHHSQLSGFSCTPSVAREMGEQKITVSYGGKTVSFNITVVERSITSVELASLPSRLNYSVGESLDTEGLLLHVTYSNGITASIAKDIAVSPERFTSIGTQTVTLDYQGRTVEFDVNVTAAVIERISVRTMPSKTVYTVGETLATRGFSLLAHYTDGTSKIITSGYTYSPKTLSKAGKQYMTVSYGGKTTGFNVTVNAAADTQQTASITGISVCTNPTRTSYMTGDTLDTSGLSLTVRYSDGSTRNVSNGFSCTPTTLSLAGNVGITVSYGGHSTRFNVSVSAPVSDGGMCGDAVKWELDGGVLTVSGTGDMYDFSEGGAPWSEYANAISEVRIENGVISVGSYAFAHTSVRTVSISETVKSIDNTFVYNCLSLTDFTVSSSNRFYTSEDGMLFSRDKTKLYAYPIGRGETIFTVPSTVTTIDGYRMFCNSNVSEIVITESLYSIDPLAFEGARKLTKFTVRNRNVALTAIDGVLYTKNMNALICYPMGKSGTSYNIPEGVGVIRESAFAFNPSLTFLTLPSTIRRIEKYAFYSAKNLSSVTYTGDEAAWAKVELGEGNEALTCAVFTCVPAE